MDPMVSKKRRFREPNGFQSADPIDVPVRIVENVMILVFAMTVWFLPT